MLQLAIPFQSFPDLDSMKELVKKFTQFVKGFVPKSVIQVADFLCSHSFKVKGVSFATYEYMSDKTGLSVATLKRAIKRLFEYGFIKIERVWLCGRQRANIYIIQNKINWKHLRNLIFEQLTFQHVVDNSVDNTVDNHREENSDSTLDTQSDIPEDQQNDTLSSPSQPLIQWDEEILFGYGSLSSSSSLYELKDIKSNMKPILHPGLNWLES